MSDPDQFPHPTLWTRVWRAAGRDSTESRAALDALLEAYYQPLRSHARFLCRKYRDLVQADDLVNEFVLSGFLQNQIFAKADPQRGRFRSFLKCCLSNFLTHRIAEGLAVKRGGAIRHVELHDDGTVVTDENLCDDEIPEAGFDRAWALATYERAISRHRDYETRRGRADAYDLFLNLLMQEMTVEQVLAALAKPDSPKERASIYQRKLRFADQLSQCLRKEVQETLLEPTKSAVDEELSHLRELLSQVSLGQSMSGPTRT